MTSRAIGRYELLREVGRGGMAIVHLARQRPLERFVAVKELRTVGLSEPAAARRFLRESRLAGSLSHPNIVTVHDYFEWDGTPYIAMEYLARGSLRPWVGRLSTAEAVGVVVGLLSALTAAERERIVHRDLKPENIMVTAEGSVKIADFGIARALGNALPEESATATGMTIGTPSYMAPEQALAQPIGPWTDLYSTGVIAFELLSGRLPFIEPVPAAMLMKHINDEAPSLSSVASDVEPELSSWVARLLAKDPGDRPHSALLASEELEELALGLFGPRWRRDAAIPPDATPPTSSFARPSPTEELRIAEASGGGNARRAAAEAHITAWRQTAERRRMARGDDGTARAGDAVRRREAMGDGAGAAAADAARRRAAMGDDGAAAGDAARRREAMGDGAAGDAARRRAAMGDDGAAAGDAARRRAAMGDGAAAGAGIATGLPTRRAGRGRRRPVRAALLFVALFIFGAGAIATLFAPREPARPTSQRLNDTRGTSDGTRSNLASSGGEDGASSGANGASSATNGASTGDAGATGANSGAAGASAGANGANSGANGANSGAADGSSGAAGTDSGAAGATSGTNGASPVGGADANSGAPGASSGTNGAAAPAATVDPDLSGVGDSRSDDPSDDEPDGDGEP